MTSTLLAARRATLRFPCLARAPTRLYTALLPRASPSAAPSAATAALRPRPAPPPALLTSSRLYSALLPRAAPPAPSPAAAADGAPLGGALAQFVRGLKKSRGGRPHLMRQGKAIMGRAYRGLYDGKHIFFGNNVSHARNKTRRTWKPNIHYKRFWSETYERFVEFRVAASVIKKVKKLAHGIDEYLMRTPNDTLLYRNAIKMKRNLLRIHRQRAAMVDAAAAEGSPAAAEGAAALEAEAVAGEAVELGEEVAEEAARSAAGVPWGRTRWQRVYPKD